MRIGEVYSYLPQSNVRSAAPALAKELPSDSESLDNDSVTGVAVTAADNRESRIAELRQQVQSGNYKVDAEAVSSKLIDSHLDR